MINIWKEFLRVNVLAALLTATTVVPREAGRFELVMPEIVSRVPTSIGLLETSVSIRATEVLGSTVESEMRLNLERLSGR